MTLPRTVADVLARHVSFEVESIDRMYCNVYQPKLQYTAGAAGFFVGHRGFTYASSALMAQMTEAYVADLYHFIAAHDVPLVQFAKGQHKDDVTQQYLTGHDGTEQVRRARKLEPPPERAARCGRCLLNRTGSNLSVTSSFNRFVRELERFLTDHGYERAGGRVFRKYSPVGDALVLDVQTSSASDRTVRVFFLDTALVLGPAYAMYRRRTGRPDTELPRGVHGLWRDRVHVDHEDQFTITEHASADAVWQAVRPALQEQLAQMDELLDRDRLREGAENGERRRLWASNSFVRAWPLAAEGDEEGLNELLTAECSVERRASDGVQDMLTYAAERAAESK